MHDLEKTLRLILRIEEGHRLGFDQRHIMHDVEKTRGFTIRIVVFLLRSFSTLFTIRRTLRLILRIVGRSGENAGLNATDSGRSTHCRRLGFDQRHMMHHVEKTLRLILRIEEGRRLGFDPRHMMHDAEKTLRLILRIVVDPPIAAAWALTRGI